MTTQAFIKEVNQKITPEGMALMTNFFITFSRFECSLKASNFLIGGADRVSPNWDTFIASIRTAFNRNSNAQLNEAVNYLIQHPPRIQIFEQGSLAWRARVFQANEAEINKLSLSIRDIRNNLFHGGKFNGNYQEDVSRNFTLLKSAMIILDEWLNLSAPVRNNFLQSIS